MLDTVVVRKGYLYLLKNLILGGYKIGITTAPKSRFKQLSVGSKSELIGYWEHEAYRELEKYFHKLYAEYRVPQSEWFDLSQDHIQSVIDVMHTAGLTQYVSTDYTPKYTSNRPVVTTAGPELSSTASWNYFGLLVLTALLSYTLGAVVS